MVNSETPESPGTATGTGTPTATLSPEEFIRQLRALHEQMPRFDESQSLAPRRTLRGRLQHVDANFITAAVAAVGASPPVQSALGRTEDELRQEIDLIGRWSAAADEARALLRSIIVTNTVRRQRIGLAALQTYKICAQLQRDGTHPKLATHVAEMKRLNRFGRARRRPPASEPLPDVLAKTP